MVRYFVDVFVSFKTLGLNAVTLNPNSECSQALDFNAVFLNLSISASVALARMKKTIQKGILKEP